MCAKSLGTTFVYVVSTFLANAQTNIWNQCQVKKRVRTWLAYHNMCIRLLYDKSFAACALFYQAILVWLLYSH